LSKATKKKCGKNKICSVKKQKTKAVACDPSGGDWKNVGTMGESSLGYWGSAGFHVALSPKKENPAVTTAANVTPLL